MLDSPPGAGTTLRAELPLNAMATGEGSRSAAQGAGR